MALLIIDGDHCSYRMAASCEPTKAKVEREPLSTALSRIDSTMHHIKQACNSEEYELYIAGDNNFRKTLYPLYKANRTQTKPMWLEDCREYLITTYGAKIVNDVEVDDMCGIRMTAMEGMEECICVSLDKDLLQLPGRHYNFVNKEHTTTSPLEGLRIFYKHIILGDASDNVPGFDGKLRNICPKFVYNLQTPIDEMVEEKTMYNYVVEVYNGDVATVHLRATLLYVLRREGEFWQPPK
jgi:5'-3' exonuclease